MQIVFFCLNKYQSVTHVSTSIFEVLFKNIDFRSVALVIKKVMGYFRFLFYTLQTFYRPVPYPMHKKKIQKNSLNYYF